MHGDQDDLVPLGQSEVLAAALKKAGVEVTLQVVQGNGHGGPGFSSPENRKLIEDFFAKHLTGPSTAKAEGTSGEDTARPHHDFQGNDVHHRALARRRLCELCRRVE